MKTSFYYQTLFVLSAIASSSFADVQVRLKPGNDFVVTDRGNGTNKFTVRLKGGVIFPLYESHADLVNPVEVGEYTGIRQTSSFIVRLIRALMVVKSFGLQGLKLAQA